MTTIEIDEELASVLTSLNRPLADTVRELMVLELYRRGSISSGKAAELLDMSRWEWVRYASRLGIPFIDMTEDEWAMEAARL